MIFFFLGKVEKAFTSGLITSYLYPEKSLDIFISINDIDLNNGPLKAVKKKYDDKVPLARILNEDRLILEANYVSRTSYRFPPINWLIPKFLSKKFLIFSSPFLGQDKKFKFIDSYALNS